MQKFGIANMLSHNQKRFFAELVGTFAVVVLSAGSVVIATKHVETFGLWFVALCPALAIAIMVYMFAKTSMAHFNPAVTIGFLITRHMPRRLLGLYLLAELTGASLGALFVRFFIGTEANLGSNSPNYSFSIPLIFGVEALATAFLMGIILIVVHTGGLRGFGSIGIGAVVGLDIFFLSFISGASMNPARSLAPAIFSWHINDLWLYLTATFVGSGMVAFFYRLFLKRVT